MKLYIFCPMPMALFCSKSCVTQGTKTDVFYTFSVHEPKQPLSMIAENYQPAHFIRKVPAKQLLLYMKMFLFTFIYFIPKYIYSIFSFTGSFSRNEQTNATIKHIVLQNFPEQHENIRWPLLGHFANIYTYAGFASGL